MIPPPFSDQNITCYRFDFFNTAALTEVLNHKLGVCLEVLVDIFFRETMLNDRCFFGQVRIPVGMIAVKAGVNRKDDRFSGLVPDHVLNLRVEPPVQHGIDNKHAFFADNETTTGGNRLSLFL